MEASQSVWERLRYFKRDSKIDNWGPRADILDSNLLLSLDDFRHYLGLPVIVSSATGGVHVAGSVHYLGKACDIVVPDFRDHALDLIFAALRFRFVGLGFYPEWKFSNRVCGGLHLDMRTGDAARWLGVKKGAGKTGYLPLTYANLKDFGVL